MARPSNLSKTRTDHTDAVKLAKDRQYVELQHALLVDTLERLKGTDSAREAAPLLRIATALLVECAEAEAALGGGE